MTIEKNSIYVQASDAVTEEIFRQNRMWGDLSERSDVDTGELLMAGIAHAEDAYHRDLGYTEEVLPATYPFHPDCFRNYGSKFATLVVAAAFIHQELAHLILEGADTTRRPRDSAEAYPVESEPRFTE